MTTLKGRPLIMTGESVRATIDGSKTMTRRVLKPQPEGITFGGNDPLGHVRGFEWRPNANTSISSLAEDFPRDALRYCDFQIGMRLWVKETWATLRDEDECTISELVEMNAMGPASLFYKADGTPHHSAGKWRSPLYMPRAYSRLTLEVVSVKIERLDQIRLADTWAEGIPIPDYIDDSIADRVRATKECFRQFRDRWQAINGKRKGCSWELNPWVSAIEYKVVTQPVGREERE